MTTSHKYLVTVLKQDGSTATSLHFTDEDMPTRLRLIADDLGPVIDDHGYLKDDPDIRSVTIRRADDLVFEQRKL